MVDLDELMRLREAATPGPWYATHDINGDIAPFVEGATGWVFGEGFDPIDGESYMRPSFNDLEYIVAACNAVPDLVARIRELEVQRDWLAQVAANAGWHGIRVSKEYIIEQAKAMLEEYKEKKGDYDRRADTAGR